MATVEQNPAAQQRIAHTRSTRLADHAATAALYVTHPERSLSIRQPTAEPDPATLKLSGSRPGLSSASAAAALIAHARKQELGAGQAASASHAADHRNTTSTNYDGYPYQAAMRAIKERKAPGVNGNRKRAESAPSEPARTRARARTQGPSDPFDDLDRYENASRIKYAHLNPKLFTAAPPVAPELEEHRRKSILEAASMSMAKDMYGAMERKERGVAGRQGLPARARSQRSGSKSEAATLQQASSNVLRQALNLQDVAQKRAAEKLASLEDESAEYRNYYGVESQAVRSSFSLRRRRGSNETEQFDVEQSREIRTQMSTLRSKLNAIDEKREKDRASLLELARKNVDATIQDMDRRLYTGSGQSVVMQRYLEERARERAQKGIKEIDAQYAMADKVAIGGRRYVEMTDVEDLARSRLQPTFDEIDDLAQTQRARDLEARLDEEQRQRLLALELEREAEIQMEKDRHNELSMQELKSKEEKVWPWKRKSRHMQGTEHTPEKDTTQQPTEEHTNGATAISSEAPQNQIQEAQAASQGETLSRQESKFKSWFKDRLGRRSSASPSKEINGTHEDQTAGGPTEQEPSATTAPQGTAYTDEPQELEADRAEVSGEEVRQNNDPDAEYTQTSRPVSGVAYAPEGDTRAVPLRSNPVTASDLNNRTQNGSDTGVDKLDGMTPSEYVAVEQGSKEIVERSNSLKQQRQQEGAVHELPTSSYEKETPRESTSDHRAAISGIEDVVSKRMSNSTTTRESRFSEDL